MHIPDSMISPTTSLAAGAAMAPVWYAAARKLRAALSSRQVPLLSMGAAFSFVVMMFNIPVFGGSTVHPVGAALLAVLLGPWAAVIGVTVALTIQALFFADGGVLAIGANCFTMAFAMPFTAFVVYRLAAGRSPTGSWRRAAAAGLGAYVGINAAALLTALLLGIQPALYRDAGGHALYFPFGLGVTIPAMMAAHLTIAGLAEAIVTALAVRGIQRLGVPLYGMEPGAAGAGSRGELAWAALGALVALSPLGLLATGEAWGEWSPGDLARRAGYLPQRLEAAERHGWKGFAWMPDYLGERGPAFYVLAALLGGGGIALIGLGLGRALARREEPPADHEDGAGPGGPPGVAPGELPEWMRGHSPSGGDGRPTPSGPNRRAAFLDRTLASLAEAARDALVGERWAGRPGLLQRLDPRARLVGLLALVVAASLLHRPASLAALYLLALLLAVSSRVPLRALHNRLWLGVLSLALVAALPASLSVATPGTAVVVLLRRPYLAVTTPGLEQMALLLCRTAASVSLVMLLALTTRWHELLRALRALLLPPLFVAVLTMTYRYLAVLAQVALDTFTARRSRSLGASGAREGRGFVGGAMATLFGRTLSLADEIHGAMRSRGWDGEAPRAAPMRLRGGDLAWLGAICLAALAALGGERLVR